MNKQYAIRKIYTVRLLLSLVFLCLFVAIPAKAHISSIGTPEYVNLLIGKRAACINYQLNREADVWGTDLGILNYHPPTDRMYYVYGDTFSTQERDFEDLRSPTMSKSRKLNVYPDSVFNGEFYKWITQGTGEAAQLWPYTHHLPVDCSDDCTDLVTNIPTTAFSVGSTMYIWHMSVRCWEYYGQKGYWETIRSRLRYSNDGGNTWLRGPLVAGANDRMAMAAVLQTLESNPYKYFYVNYPGRWCSGKNCSGLHEVYLIRAPETAFQGAPATPIPWEYLTYTGWTTSKESWDVNPMVVIGGGNIGELSVMQKSGSIDDYFIALYKDYSDLNVKIAQSSSIEGPFQEVGNLDLSTIENPLGGYGFLNSYGGFIHPKLTKSGPGYLEVYFTLSEWGNDIDDRYKVHLLKVRLYD